YIGSGEVILAPRAGAILGLTILWVPFFGIFLKYWIGLAGARYTVCTGEGMVDMLSRTPGPKNWVIYLVFIGQLASGAISSAAIAAAAGAFTSYFIPISSTLLGWIIAAAVFTLTFIGGFNILKSLMSIMVLLIIIGVLDVTIETWPGLATLANGIFGFHVPAVPDWAFPDMEVKPSPWAEILPLLGWAAGGFASQVWYTYWVIGAGYGMTAGRGYGKPLDPEQLKAVDEENANSLKGWCRVVSADATMGMLIGILVTLAFAIAGAGVLGPAQVAPEGNNVAFTLSRIFGEKWGEIGAHLYVLAGLAALISTMLGQFAGWPRLLADCGRILFPGFGKIPWLKQFRLVLILFTFSNMVIVYGYGVKPVLLVQLGAVLDGLLLTPLQAVAVGVVLYLVMPKFFSKEAWKIIKPSPVYAVMLSLAFLVFSYFCLFKLWE
ncbi:MAG: Nramp family divalent metal transporter, partial [Candidatus Omnitrophica bacterium]|nr:Nramp family divalent metal transporter [Candidatus Omnitrophota bacterium]